jgi:hypothetical protein
MRKGRKQTNRKIQKKDEDTIQNWKKKKMEKEGIRETEFKHKTTVKKTRQAIYL